MYQQLCLRLVALLLLSDPVWGADWPQYRGPAGDGSPPELIRTNWSEAAPEVLWRRPFDPGWSSPVVRGNRLFTQVKRTINGEAREVCVALDADTGNELWARNVDAASYSDLVGYNEAIDGPRSTPSLDGDHVYVFTSYLKLYCLRTDTGAVVWSRDFIAELGSTVIGWQNAASPLVVGDRIFVNSNASGKRLTAVRKSDGVTLWSVRNEIMTHATPIYAGLGGVPQVVFLTGGGLVALAPDDGSLLWRLAFTPSGTSTASTPVVAGEYLHASSTYSQGRTWVARVSRQCEGFAATLAVVQPGTQYQSHWASPVVHDGFIYAIPSPSPAQARLACFDPVRGTNRWIRQAVGSGNLGYGSVIKAANALVVLTEAGELVLVEPDPTMYREIVRFGALTTTTAGARVHCWNNPALANGRLFARSGIENSPILGEIVALDVTGGPAPLLVPPLAISLALFPESCRLRLTVRAMDGSALNADIGGQLECRRASVLPAVAGDWQAIPAEFASTGDELTVDLSYADDVPVQYLQVREKVAD